MPVRPDGLADLLALLVHRAAALRVTVEAECRGSFDNYERNVTGRQILVQQVVEFSMQSYFRGLKTPVQGIMSPLL
jgi:hypothetical protein